MTYITPAYVDFFTALATHNERDWFQTHKKRYEEAVKKPFEALITQLLAEASALYGPLEPDPKQAIYRINRDVRFSADKSPYNTLMKASLAPGGKKSGAPAFYVGISHEFVHVGGGVMGLKGAPLKALRTHLADDPADLIQAVEQAEFKQLFPDFGAEVSKVVPAELKPHLVQHPWLATKSWVLMARRPVSELLEAPDQTTYLLDRFATVAPVLAQLQNALP